MTLRRRRTRYARKKRSVYFTVTYSHSVNLAGNYYPAGKTRVRYGYVHLHVHTHTKIYPRAKLTKTQYSCTVL